MQMTNVMAIPSHANSLDALQNGSSFEDANVFFVFPLAPKNRCPQISLQGTRGDFRKIIYYLPARLSNLIHGFLINRAPSRAFEVKTSSD